MEFWWLWACKLISGLDGGTDLREWNGVPQETSEYIVISDLHAILGCEISWT